MCVSLNFAFFKENTVLVAHCLDTTQFPPHSTKLLHGQVAFSCCCMHAASILFPNKTELGKNFPKMAISVFWPSGQIGKLGVAEIEGGVYGLLFVLPDSKNISIKNCILEIWRIEAYMYN